jgi:hypothetical protein
LMEKMISAVDNLVKKGIDQKLIVENSLITPSCGTGTMPIEDATKAMTLTHELTVKLKDKYKIT